MLAKCWANQYQQIVLTCSHLKFYNVCLPSGWSLMFSTGMGRFFLPYLSQFIILHRHAILLSAHLFAVTMNSSCWLTQVDRTSEQWSDLCALFVPRSICPEEVNFQGSLGVSHHHLSLTSMIPRKRGPGGVPPLETMLYPSKHST